MSSPSLEDWVAVSLHPKRIPFVPRGRGGGEGRMVLAGIRVLDVGSFVAGPAAATVMGDFGAEVIKIEPPEGDPYRGLHRLPGSPEGDRDYYWVLDSRNKK